MHPFAARRQPQLETSFSQCSVFTSPPDAAFITLVAQHVVRGRVVFPGAAYLEAARASFARTAGSTRGSARLYGVFFLQPLFLDVTRHIEVRVGDGRFEVRSGEPRDASLTATVTNCSGQAAAAVRSGTHHVDHAVWPMKTALSVRCVRAVGVRALYDGLHAMGLQYGPAYRMLTQTWASSFMYAPALAVGQLRARCAQQGTSVHPADLDSALQLNGLVTAPTGSSETRLPFALDDATLRRGLGGLWAVRATHCILMRACTLDVTSSPSGSTRH